MPAVKGVVGVPPAEVVVAHDAAQHAVLAAADAVHVVDGYLGEGGDIYFELELVGYLCGELGVEGVDAFHHKDAVGTELDAFAVVEGVTFEEIEGGNLDPLAVEHALQVVVEQGDVEGVDGLEVVVAVGQSGCAGTADEVVVERQLFDIKSHDGELHAESAARGGLARRGRPCHQYHAHLVAFAINHVGNLGVAFLMQCFGNVDELHLVIVANNAVEVGDGGEVQTIHPEVVELEDVEELGGVGQQGRPVDVVRVGHLEYIALVGIHVEVPIFEAPGAGDEF